MTTESADPNAQAVANSLKSVLDQILQKKCGFTYSEETQIEERQIIEYRSRLRADGLEKFNGPCYAVGVNFYNSDSDKEQGQACGTLVLYIEEESVEGLLKGLGHRGFDEDDSEFVLENLSQFARDVSSSLASSLQSSGHSSLVSSDPISNKNSLPEGVPFPSQMKNYQELNFFLWKKKAIVACVVLSPA